MSIIPVTVPTGAIRYNTDSNKMECYNGTKWMQVAVSESTPIGARGLIGGASSNGSIINYYTIATAGDAVDFGDLNNNVDFPGSVASRTRGIWGGGRTPTNLDVIDFVTISTAGNALDFGDLTAAKQSYGSCSNSTRGTFLGGQTPSYINNIDMVTIASTGDATDFGDVNIGVTALGAAGSDSHGGLAV